MFHVDHLLQTPTALLLSVGPQKQICGEKTHLYGFPSNKIMQETHAQLKYSTTMDRSYDYRAETKCFILQ